MKTITVRSIGPLLAVLFATLAAGPATSPHDAIVRLFRQSVTDADLAPSVLAEVHSAKVQSAIDSLMHTYGPLQSVDGDEQTGAFTAHLASADIPTAISLDEQGRISGLRFGAPQSTDVHVTLEQAVQAFATLPGKVSVLVTADSQPLASLHAETPLAIGSTFKLAILSALKSQIAAGQHHWDDVVPLQAQWKSLPTGILHTWPEGTPLTLATLANEMISISDNTAADALLSIVGQQAVETITPRNTPFLSTRRAFVIKANEDLHRRYLADKIATFADVDRQPLPPISRFTGGPINPDIEWFFTAKELAILIDSVADLPAFTINPGIARRDDWGRIAFKGGGEPGVLNLTTALVAKSGEHYTLVATWNDAKSLDIARFSGLYNTLLAVLARRPAATQPHAP